MSTNTPHLSLKKPAATDQIGQTIIDLGSNFDILDNQAPIVCTSATRPTPASGMIIYETDTGKVLYWNAHLYTPAWVRDWVTIASATVSSMWLNVTIGNGKTGFQYYIDGKTMYFRCGFVMGSTSSVTGLFGINMPTGFTHQPLASVSTYDTTLTTCVGSAFASISSESTRWTGSLYINNTTTALFNRVIGSGGNTGWTTAQPAAWATGDKFSASGFVVIA